MSSELRQLTGSMLKVGAIGFGGGSALIPVIEKEIVYRRQLLDDATFTAHTVIANVTPGALPVKLGALAGATVGRAGASLAAAFAVALPGTFATVGLLASFAAIGPKAIRYVEFAAVGITAFILVLLGLYIAKVLRHAHQRWLAVGIMMAAFLATGANKVIAVLGDLFGFSVGWRVPAISALGLILVSIAAIGVSTLIWRRGSGSVPVAEATPGRGTRPAILWFTVLTAVAILIGWVVYGAPGLEFLGLIAGSAVSSFGGGEAYVGVADGFFVRPGHVSSAEFYGQLVPVANALPGPILVKVAAGVGFIFGSGLGGWMLGLSFALFAFAASVASCSGVSLVVLSAYDRFAQSLFMQRLGAYILPVICGLLLTTSCAMVAANAEIAHRAGILPIPVAWGTLLGALALWWLHRRFGLPDLILLAIAGGTSLLALSLA